MSEPRAIEARVEWADGERKAFLVGDWPERTDFDGGLLRDPQLWNLTVEDDVITLTLENGSARYRIDRHDWATDRYEATLLRPVEEATG